MSNKTQEILAPFNLKMIISYLKEQEEGVRAHEAEVLIESAGLDAGMLEDFRRIELSSSSPDFDYIQEMDELLDILAI